MYIVLLIVYQNCQQHHLNFLCYINVTGKCPSYYFVKILEGKGTQTLRIIQEYPIFSLFSLRI